MRPVKLIMTAFGPYKHQETIDFEQLKGHRLFVISGNTGAGKTTIFDAICFALYGEASGEDRNEVKMLRSQFADDDVHTYVDFTFELRGKRFRILRQMAHVKGTNKTATGDKYELYEVKGGQEVLLVDRATVGNVNQKIQEIVGLSKEQFSQIVMLPQGEFRKLLTSETENKEEILRKIFKTGLYKLVSDQLNDKRIIAQRKYEEAKHELDIIMKNIPKLLPLRENTNLQRVFEQESYNTNQILESLESEKLFYNEEYKQLETLFSEQSIQLERETARYYEQKALHDRFAVYEAKKMQLEELTNVLPTILMKETKLSEAERASNIEPFEEKYRSLIIDISNIEKKLNLTTKLKEEALTEKDIASNIYEAEEGKSPIREQAALQLSKLNEFFPIVNELEQKQNSIALLQQEVDLLVEQEESISANLQTENANRNRLITELKALEIKVTSLSQLNERMLAVKAVLKSVHEYERLATEQTELSASLLQKEIEYTNRKAAYDKAEIEWISGQASQLAAHLHDGDSCPVCGSIEHPKKAVAISNGVTKETLESLRLKKEEIETDFRSAQVQLSVLVKLLEDKQLELVSNDVNPEETNEVALRLQQEQQELQEQITKAKKDEEIIRLYRENLEKADFILEKLRSDKEKTSKLVYEKTAKLQTERALLEQSLRSIPKHLQTVAALKVELNKANEKKATLDRQWKEAQERLAQAKDRLLQVTSQLEHLITLQEATKEKQKTAYEAFMERLVAEKFTEQTYQEAKMPLQLREKMKGEISVFRTNYHAVGQQIEEMTMELTGKVRFNLVDLETKLQRLEELVESSRKKIGEIQTHRTTVNRTIANIDQASSQVTDAEESFILLKDLYDVVRGENVQKVSFERYVQIEFLDRIIQAANERLSRLSNGQFQLIRSERLEKRGRQSGLSLDVHDNYTGQNRDVKSLSGGEKFHASLSLALGMTDVIQSFQGGISIETMFIDEGFGSLDEESLNKAVDTLIELQNSGRMIGVISHVQELKNTIPAILDVRKTKEGHSKTAFIVKV